MHDLPMNEYTVRLPLNLPLYAVALLAVLVLRIGWRYVTYLRSGLRAIPTTGHSAPLLSLVTAVRFIQDSQQLIAKGYDTHRGGLYKIPLLAYWIVVATDTQAVEDIRRAPPGVLSFKIAQDIFLQSAYTAGPQVVRDKYHVDLIRTHLTRNLAAHLSHMHDEMLVAFDGVVPRGRDWRAYDAGEVLSRVVSQMSNRVFVGEPLCRDPAYLALLGRFSSEFVKSVIIMKACPEWLKPLAARFFAGGLACARELVPHLLPLIEARRAALRSSEKSDAVSENEEYNDALQWCMEAAAGEDRRPENIALRLLWINFGAIHSTTVTLVFATYHLAAHPEYADVLRDEVEEALAAEGWTKAGLNKMRKADSFLKEVLRLNPPGIWAMQRYALQPFTFSNGQTVPAGTMLACPALALHTDDAYYAAPANTFDPWRHSDASAENGEAHKNMLVTTRPDYIPFGHGADACPGRFFAASQLKMLLAHIVRTYDVRFANGRRMPPRQFTAGVCLPGKADIEFRRRA